MQSAGFESSDVDSFKKSCDLLRNCQFPSYNQEILDIFHYFQPSSDLENDLAEIGSFVNIFIGKIQEMGTPLFPGELAKVSELAANLLSSISTMTFFRWKNS